MIQVSYQSYQLRFRHPFGVSGNTRTQTPSVFLKLSDGVFYGFGEACLPPYLGETVEATEQFFELCRPLLEAFDATVGANAFLKRIDALAPGRNAAKAAVDLALHDLLAKIAGQSYAEWKGLKQPAAAVTAFTIGIDSEEVVVKKLEEAADYSVLKIKAGTANDAALIKLIRRYTSKPLYVDVNQGWKDKKMALEMACLMADNNVLLLEQPMPVSMKEEMVWLSARSPVPTIADESVKRLKDLYDLNGAFGGVNIKLMKCTGLAEALAMIDYCRQTGLKVFLGCMAESSCATGAMAQLLAYADFVDLDAPQLYLNDPFAGVTYSGGKIHPPQGPGFGTTPVSLPAF